MQIQLPRWFSPRLAIISFVIVVLGVLFVYVYFVKMQTAPDTIEYSESQLKSERATTRVYMKDSSQYRNSLSLDVQTKVESYLYGYAHFIGGNDLYTGVIREDSYTIKDLPEGSQEVQMLVDINPIDVTYRVIVKKDNRSADKEKVFVTCAPKDLQKSLAHECIQEGW